MDDAIKTALDELILQAGLAEGRGVDLDPHHREAVVEAVSAAIASAGNEGFVSGRKAGRLEGALAVAKRLSPHAPDRSPGRRIAITAPSAAISASIRAASTTIRANGGGRATPIASSTGATSATWRRRPSPS